MLQFNLKKQDETEFGARFFKVSELDYDYVFSCQLYDGGEAKLLVKDGQKWVRVCRVGAEPIDYSLTTFSAKYGFNCEIYNADMAYELSRQPALSQLAA